MCQRWDNYYSLEVTLIGIELGVVLCTVLLYNGTCHDIVGVHFCWHSYYHYYYIYIVPYILDKHDKFLKHIHCKEF